MEEEDFSKYNNEENEENKKDKKVEEQMLDFTKNDENYFYPEDYKEKIRVEENIPSALVKEYNRIGYPYHLRNNMFFISEEEIVYSVGDKFIILNLLSKQTQSFSSSDIKGIGCIAVSVNKKYIAVGECGNFPNIMIYKYDKSESPVLKLYRILRRGTENSFSAMSFNEEGNYLVSAGSDPDHNLIIWNWKNEHIILKAKAFSQEVYTVNFSNNFEGKLITSGMGHIKFWEMAKTFTGLKLQGELGKFGQVDLSDVTSFLEFPDGKILCGTEQGTLLLWEGIFIKTQVFIDENVPCHGIEAETKIEDKKQGIENKEYTKCMMDVMFWEGQSTIITAGHDGYIKWWDLNAFENAEIDDNFKSIIKPIKTEQLVNPITNVPLKIISIISNYSNKQLISYFNNEEVEGMTPINPDNMYWIVQDGHGYLIKVTLGLESRKTVTRNLSILSNGFAGNALSAVRLENTPYILCQGEDSKITFCNNISPENADDNLIASYSNISEIKTNSCCVLTPIAETEDPLIIFSGYSTGLVRVSQFNFKTKSFDIVNQIKVHEHAIKFLKVSPDRSWLLSATDTEVFIQLIQSWNNITPLFFIKKEGGINDVDWQSNSKHFLLALNDGSVEQISVQSMTNNEDTYEINNYEFKKMYLRHSYEYVDSIDEKKRKKFKQGEEPCKGKVFSVKYAGMHLEDDFFVTCCEPYEKFIFLCSFDFDKIPNSEAYDDEGTIWNLRPTNHWKLKNMKTINSRVLGGSLPKIDDTKFFKNELHIKLYSKELLIIANMNGSGITQIHHRDNLALYIEMYANPSNDNILFTAFAHNNNSLVNFCFSNGTIVSYVVDIESMMSYIKYYQINFTDKKKDLGDDFIEEDYETQLGAYIKNELVPTSAENQTNYFSSIKKNFPSNKEESIKYLKQYITLDFPLIDINNMKTIKDFLEMRSLERIKKDAELQEKQNKANEKKNKLREKLQSLKNEFSSIIKKNSSAPEEVKLMAEEMIIDEVYIEAINKTINDNLDDVKHKYDWSKAIVQGTINRLEEFFLKSVKTHVVKLYTITKNEPTQYVTTIRCPALPDNFDEALNELEKLIEEYKSKISFEPLEKEYGRHMTNKDGMDEVKEEDILAKVSQIKGRIDDFVSKTDTKSGERVNFGKDQIKTELDVNVTDMKELEHFKKSFDKNKSQILSNKRSSMVDKKKIKCPERYTLKINYDVFYTEELMKTTFEHKLEILNFLKVLYESREDFNNEMFKLRDKKIKIIQEAKLNKQKLIAINNELGIRTISDEDPKLGYENTGKYVFPPDADMENLDWLNLEMKDEEFSDNFLKIKPTEMEKYVQDKYKNEKNPNFVLSIEEIENTNVAMTSNENVNNLASTNQVTKALNKPIQNQDPFPYNGGNFNIPNIATYNEMKVNFKDRGTKKKHPSNDLFNKMKEISHIKLNYKKTKLIEESKEMIQSFDKEIKNLRKRKLDTHFKQKLGELELFIKHEEYNILRAFETDDKILIEKLEELCQNYRNNLSDLNAIEVIIQELEQKVKQKKAEREEKIAEFYKYIESEKENKSKLEKIYFTKTKRAEGKDGDDRMDNDEDLENDRPKNVTPTMYNEIILKRENRETIDNHIENFEKSIESNKKTKQNRIQTKLALDKKREDVRIKINSQERKKSKYLNLIEISFPIKIDQFCKFIGGEHNLSEVRLSLDISQAILISRNKLRKLDDLLDTTNVEIDTFNTKVQKINTNKEHLEKAKKHAIIEEKECRENFIKEQNLKFGTEINFENLLKAARDTTADKLDFEYKQMKKDADTLLDSKKELEEALKKEYQLEVNINTKLLEEIKKQLIANKHYDRSLEEKNNEINKKKEKKYELFNVQEKKEKLKEILKLLQQQMEALKKENEIFRRKGGHIYSTITSNLN